MMLFGLTDKTLIVGIAGTQLVEGLKAISTICVPVTEGVVTQVVETICGDSNPVASTMPPCDGREAIAALILAHPSTPGNCVASTASADFAPIRVVPGFPAPT